MISRGMEDTLALGGNIELSGFRDIDGARMIVLKKIVGNFARKLSDQSENFEKLSLNLKSVHAHESGSKFEMHGKVIDNGKVFASQVTDQNLFIVLDSVLKKIENSMK